MGWVWGWWWVGFGGGVVSCVSGLVSRLVRSILNYSPF